MISSFVSLVELVANGFVSIFVCFFRFLGGAIEHAGASNSGRCGVAMRRLDEPSWAQRAVKYDSVCVCVFRFAFLEK